MLKTQNSLILVFTCGLAATPGCSSNTDEGSDAKVVIGGLVDLTGDLASIGQPFEQAMRLAESEINTAGGIHGIELTVDARDTQLDADRAVGLAEELVESGVKAIAGEIASGISMAVATEVSKPNRILQCAGSSTSPAISTLDDGGYLYRTTLSDAYQGVALASLIQEEGHGETAVIYIDNAYGSGLAEVFEETYVANGGNVSAYISHAEGTSDTSVLTTIADTTTALLLVSYDSGAAYIQAARSDHPNLSIYISDGLASNDVGENLGGTIVENIKGTTPLAPDSDDSTAYANDFAAKWDREPGFMSSNYYDCTITLALAMQKAGADADGPALLEALSEIINAPGEKIRYGEYAKALQLLSEGADIDYEGIHAVELDENGDTTRGVMGIVQFGADGKLTTLSRQPVP